MNIVLINHYAGTTIHGMEYRPFYLAKEWVKLGHKVSIIAASYSHLRQENPSLPSKIAQELIGGIQYFWIRTPQYRGNGIRRVINMTVFSLSLLLRKTKIIRYCDPDLIIASSPHPFIIFGAREIARFSNAKLVFEVRDLWPLTLIELGKISPRHPFISLMQRAENYAYCASDKVVSLLPRAGSYMVEHGMAAEKFVYLPNGVDVEGWQSCFTPLPRYHAETLLNIKQSGRFIIGYTGRHGLANTLDSLIEAAALLQSYPATFVLVGEGEHKGALQSKVVSLGLNNVVFLPPVLKTSMPTLLAMMDGLFIGWKKEPLYRFGISPNKLMDYMMAGKPIIHAIGAANDLVSESGCGISVAPEDHEAIAGAVIKLLEMTPAQLQEMGLNGKKYVTTHHDYRVLAKHFLDALK